VCSQKLDFANESAERKKQIEASLDKQRNNYYYREGGIKKFVENLIIETKDPSVVYLVATRYAFLGEKEKALDCLEKAYEGRGFLSAFVKADPVFDNLRSEPRYQAILKNMGLDKFSEETIEASPCGISNHSFAGAHSRLRKIPKRFFCQFTERQPGNFVRPVG